MKIAYIAYESIDEIKAWSGTIHYMAKYLAKDNEIIPIDDLRKPKDYLYIIWMLLIRFFGKSYDFKRNVRFNKAVSRRIQKRLDKIDYDLIFAPGSTYITYIQTDKPIVVWADATFKSLTRDYPEYINFTPKNLATGDMLEKIALENCTKLIFTAKWAAQSAEDDYNIDKSKIEIVPLGANLTHQNTEQDIIKFNVNKPNDKIQLLFVGADWKKKGGDLLLSIFSELKLLSHKYTLDVVGSTPDTIPTIDGVKFHGFLKKSDKLQNEKLTSLYQGSHYFILPTKAEAFGIVFCEANSYGLPAFGSNLGGITDIIENGVNGELIDINKSPKELAFQIHKYISKGNYEDESLAAFNHYMDNFTWDKSIEKINNILRKLV